MGGRGASSYTRTKNNALAIWNGSRSSPHGAVEAASVTNPHFREGGEYQTNCQRCVIAFDMNMRGEGTFEAQPRPRGYDYWAYGGWHNAYENQVVSNIGKRTKKATERNILNTIAGMDEGARGIIRVQWQKRSYGHVFNFIREGGETKFFDAQVGRQIELHDYIQDASPSKTLISRIDGLKLSDRARRECITKVK